MSDASTEIAILGAGSWGTALAMLLAQNGYHPYLWGRDREEMRKIRRSRVNTRYLPNFKLSEAIQIEEQLDFIKNVNNILLVVPSVAFQPLLIEILPYFSSQARIAWGTKGLDSSHRFFHQTVQELLGQQVSFAILSGPSLAVEVAAGLPTAITIASQDPIFSKMLLDQLHNDYFRVYLDSDIIGVQLCGAVKNILAIATGICDGMKLGSNARSALITRGLAEMKKLCEALGGKTETLLGLAGVGDLILTCTDNRSRNRRFGMALGEGMGIAEAQAMIGQAIEGLTNCEQVVKLSSQHHIEMPITQQIHSILQGKISSREALKNLLSRPLKFEMD